MLTNGTRVQGQFDGEVHIGDELGSGGQGAVYRGTNTANQQVAVKWYFPAEQTTERRTALTDLVVRGSPSKHFLWPEDIATGGAEFGYVMQLYPPDFVAISKLMKRKVEIRFTELIRAASHTVSAFKALQSQGLFYCDISANNLRVNPQTGDILICDNDNVRATQNSGIAPGTPKYMAPEVARGEVQPSALTDSFSLAVLLFYLLFNDHPLDGAAVNRIKVMTPTAMKKAYGTDPVFSFDPNNDTNRPEPGVQRNSREFWNVYPNCIEDILTKVFTTGRFDPGARPTFSEWQRALAALEDSLMPCPSCAEQNFFDADAGPRPCWSCRQTVGTPLRLVLDGKRTVVLNLDTKLYNHHVTKLSGDPENQEAPVAAMSKHPEHDRWGLTNLGTTQWFATFPDGSSRSIEPGRTLPAGAGIKISFGEVSAEIV
jgi:DNA-binding helix-hairpin-helix protein with protein kinase domain